MSITRIDSFETRVSDLPDKPSANMSTTEVKAVFDASPEELRVKLNEVIDDVNKSIKPTDFTNSLLTNGYQKLLNGLLIQWGKYSIPYSGATITFPIPFPNNCFGVTATCIDYFGYTRTNTLTKTGCQVYQSNTYANNVFIIAIGN